MAGSRRVTKGILAAVSVAAALLLAEGLWRLFFERPAFAARSELSAPGMIVPHPTRGYTLAPGWSGRMKSAEFDVGFRTDALGCRIPALARAGCVSGDRTDIGIGSTIDEGARTCTILTLGDSFTFGHGLEEEQAWPEQLARRIESLPPAPPSASAPEQPAQRGAQRRVCLVNGAVSGYNMAQVRDRAEELAPQAHPDLIVLGLFVNGAERMKIPYGLYEGDIVRVNERPRLRAVEGGFLHTRLNRPSLQSIDFWLGERFYVGAAAFEQSYRLFEWATNAPGHYWRRLRGSRDDRPRGPTEEGERAYLAPMLDEVGKVDVLARSIGARFVVLVIHVQREDGGFREIDERFSRLVTEYGEAHGIPVCDPTPLLKARARGAPVHRYSRGDAHWSAAAHALAAEELAGFLEKKGIALAVGNDASRTEAGPTPATRGEP